MASHDDSPPDWLPQLARIEDPIADDLWEYELPDKGGRQTSRITIGRPVPLPGDAHGDWYCPVFAEHFLPAIRCVVGVGPVDALMNAMSLVRTFFEQVGGASPRAQAPLSP